MTSLVMNSGASVPSIASLVHENCPEFLEFLPAENDEHGGVIVDINEVIEPAIFSNLLRVSISQWKRQGKKGVWIKIPIELAYLIEIVVKEGFRYHHAEPNYLMLVNWIPKTPNTIPANATHRVRIGAIVFNDKNEILVVQEKSGVFRGTGVWKIPTGVVDEGEDINKAVEREIKEETGIETEFLEISAFRESHKRLFEKSELFFLCMMRPLSFGIQKQDLEIEAAQWMRYEEYAAQPINKTHELFRYITEICSAKLHGDYAGFFPRPTISAFTNQSSNLYLNTRDLK